MSNDTPIRTGCSAQFAELCAISTTGELSSEEWGYLNAHLAECPQCSDLLAEFAALTSSGMSKLAPDPQWSGSELNPLTSPRYDERKSKLRLVESLRQVQPDRKWNLAAGLNLSGYGMKEQNRGRIALFAGAAAVILACIGGWVQVARRAVPAAVQAPLAAHRTQSTPVDTEKIEMQRKLDAALKSLHEITARSVEAQDEIADLSRAKESLTQQIDRLTQEQKANAESLADATQQRDSLELRLGDASTELERVKTNLDLARQDRANAVLRAASLEGEVNRLNVELTLNTKSTTTSDKLLAQDRDVRELMGARQLYIADVFDVEHDGQKSKPFGRVFYTKGKSLIFYAFDLDAQRGYRETKTFQAWGKPDSSNGKTVSLGIFYMESETNRRWVLKSDDPDVLARINSVFVTVEPSGGSSRPTSRPFLEASLHSLPPNHQWNY